MPNQDRAIYGEDGKPLTMHTIDAHLFHALAKWRDAYLNGEKMATVESDLLRACGMYSRANGGLKMRYD